MITPEGPITTTPKNCTKTYSPTGPDLCSDYYGWTDETSLDVEWSHVMAPQANILLVGSDSGDGNPAYGARGEALNDVTILIHFSTTSDSATAVSIPNTSAIPAITTIIDSASACRPGKLLAACSASCWPARTLLPCGETSEAIAPTSA